MTLHVLIIWAVLGGNASAPFGWVPMGEFQGKARCEAAAAELGTTKFRCPDTGKRVP